MARVPASLTGPTCFTCPVLRTDWGPSTRTRPAPARCAVATSYFSTQRIPGRQPRNPATAPNPGSPFFSSCSPSLFISVYRLDSATRPPSATPRRHFPSSGRTRRACVVWGVIAFHRNPLHPRPITNATLHHPYPQRADLTPSIHRHRHPHPHTHTHASSHVQSRIVASSHCPRVIASQIPQDTNPPPIRHHRNLSPTTPLGSHQSTTTTTTDTTTRTLTPSRLLPCVTVVVSHPPRRQARHPPRLQMRAQ